MSAATIDRSDLTTWPKAERMAFLACKCEHACHEPEHWQGARDAQRLCARCDYMIRPFIDRAE